MGIYRVKSVDNVMVSVVWESVKSYIEDALTDYDDIDGIKADIEKDIILLFVIVNEDDQIVGAFTTSIEENTFNGERYITCITLGGMFMSAWLDKVEQAITETGKQNGCKKAILNGRRGWVKELRRFDWHENHVIMSKEL